MTKTKKFTKKFNKINTSIIESDYRRNIEKIDSALELFSDFMKYAKERKENIEAKYFEDLNLESYTAPIAVSRKSVEKKLPVNFHKKGVTEVWMFKGNYYTLPQLCNLMNLNYSMVVQRLRAVNKNGEKWNMVKVFGVENHALDNLIVENVKMMEN